MIKGFKVFNPDFTCRDFQFEVGKTYEIQGALKMCANGFHFCLKPNDCFDYYSFNSSNKVCEVEALGEVIKSDNNTKCVTNKILIVKELNWYEVLTLVNLGKDNTGRCNTGNRNTGNRNTGDWNTGDWNTGDWNTGNRNTGDWNTGNRNTGNRNSGDFNSCNNSSGVFCTNTPKLLIFDTPTQLTLQEWRDSEPAWILRKLVLTEWVYTSDMTDEEKINHKKHETTNGYLKKYSYKEAWQNLWNSLNVEEKDIIQRIPNFDKTKFENITGIELEEI